MPPGRPPRLTGGFVPVPGRRAGFGPCTTPVPAPRPAREANCYTLRYPWYGCGNRSAPSLARQRPLASAGVSAFQRLRHVGEQRAWKRASTRSPTTLTAKSAALSSDIVRRYRPASFSTAAAAQPGAPPETDQRRVGPDHAATCRRILRSPPEGGWPGGDR